MSCENKRECFINRVMVYFMTSLVHFTISCPEAAIIHLNIHHQPKIGCYLRRLENSDYFTSKPTNDHIIQRVHFMFPLPSNQKAALTQHYMRMLFRGGLGF